MEDKMPEEITKVPDSVNHLEQQKTNPIDAEENAFLFHEKKSKIQQLKKLFRKNIVILALANFFIGFGNSIFWIVYQPYFLQYAPFLGDRAVIVLGAVLTTSSLLSMI